MGAFSRIPALFFFLIGMFVLVIHALFRGKIYFPVKSTDYSLFLLFIVVVCVISLLNLPDILSYYFKQTSGLTRFLRQIISVTLVGIGFFLLFFNVCKDIGTVKFFKQVRRVFLIAFAIVFTGGMLEFVIETFKITALEPVFQLFNYLPFTEINISYNFPRLSATTYEPPALGTYLLTIGGFMFSYILTSKKIIRFLPFVAVVFLAVISKSRLALVVILLQVGVGVFFTYLKYRKFRKLFNQAVVVGGVFLCVLLIAFWQPVSEKISDKLSSLDFTQIKYDSENSSISNKTRFGMQYAMLKVIQEQPFLGVGWGQQAYESRFHYPKWATENNYEFSYWYLNEEVKDFPPSFNMYLRIWTESGIIGLLVFLSFIISIGISALRLYRTSSYPYITIALLISFVGYYLDWLQIDAFRLIGFWLCLVLLICLKHDSLDQLDHSEP